MDDASALPPLVARDRGPTRDTRDAISVEPHGPLTDAVVLAETVATDRATSPPDPDDNRPTHELIPVEDHLRDRLQASETRLRSAVRRLRHAAQRATPAAQLRAHPLAFVAGGFAVGFLVGVLTARR